MDLSGVQFERFEKARHEAEEAESRGDLLKAAAAYRTAAKWMREYALGHRDVAIRHERLKTADAYEKRADLVEKKASEKRMPAPPVSQPDDSQKEEDYEAQVMNLIHKSSVRWEDIGGLENTKRGIKMAYALALAEWPAGVENNNRRNNILLYGPPGTGKTLLAAATAGSLQATFFNVVASNLLSKYFGESTKLVEALYTAARKVAPSVIFMDEFEALTPDRSGGTSGPEARIVSTLLAQLDGLATKDDQSFVLTIAATNLPRLLDRAILSRFQMQVYVPLPDPDTRRAILKIHLAKQGFKSEVAEDELVRRTEGYSGREIQQLCKAAVSKMVSEHNPDLLDAVDKGLDAVKTTRIKVAALSESDFTGAFATIRPKTSPAMIRDYEEWAKEIEK